MSRAMWSLYRQHPSQALDIWFSIVELFVAPPMDQFYKYVPKGMYEQILDRVWGTKFSPTLLDPPETVKGVHASWQDGPLTLHMNISQGPTVFLFDVCEDPNERHNLAGQRPKDVARLFQQLYDESMSSPVQWGRRRHPPRSS